MAERVELEEERAGLEPAERAGLEPAERVVGVAVGPRVAARVAGTREVAWVEAAAELSGVVRQHRLIHRHQATRPSLPQEPLPLGM